MFIYLEEERRKEEEQAGGGLCSHSRFLFDEKKRGRLGSCYVFGG